MPKPKLQSYQIYKYPVNFINMTLMGSVEFVGSGGQSGTDWFYVKEDQSSTPVAVFVVPPIPTGSASIKLALTSGSATSDVITIPPGTAPNTAFLVTKDNVPVEWTDVDSVSLSSPGYGSAGDIVEIIGCPNPLVDEDWVKINYVRSNDISSGPNIAPVADGMDPAKCVIRVRSSNTFSISGQYIKSSIGLGTLRGRQTCLLIEMHEDGGPVVDEYIILGGASIGEYPISASDNAEVTTSISGTYRRLLIYTP